MRSGYVIRLNNFTLRIDFNDNHKSLRTTESYLIKSDEALWGIVTWVHINKDALIDKNTKITLHIAFRVRKINYWELELPENINKYEADRAIVAYGKYNGKEDFAANVGKIISAMLGIPFIPPDENIEIPIYMISISTFGNNLPNQFEESHIFMGPMYGKMENYINGKEFIVFLNIESARTYLDEYIITEYTLEQITLSKKTIFEIFNILY